MSYLIAELMPGLLIAVALGAIAGWNLYAHLFREKIGGLEEERRNARDAILRLAAAPGEDELKQQRDLVVLVEALRSTVEALRRDLATAQAEAERSNHALALRAQELDEQRAAGEAIRMRLAQVEQALAEAVAARHAEGAAFAAEREALATALASGQTQARLSHWRLRYFEARARFLEGRMSRSLAGTAPLGALEALQQERDRLAGRVAALEPLEAEAAGRADELNRLVWQNRYLAARVRHLEGVAMQAAPAPAPVVEDRRRAWRLRYFETRAGLLEAAAGRIPALEAERQALAARGAELEAALARLTQAVGDRDLARDEAAGLRVRLEALEAELTQARIAAQAGGRVPELEAQVAQLEGRLSQALARAITLETAAAQVEALRAQLAGADSRLLAAERDAEEARRRADAFATSLARRPDEAQVRKLRWRSRYLEDRVQSLEARLGPEIVVAPAPPAPPAPIPMPPPPLPAAIEVRPGGLLSRPRGGAPDDLRLIQGVTPSTERQLNDFGVFHFDQIAEWTSENVAWVDRYWSLRGRIERERWVEQAKRLAAGELPNTSGLHALDVDVA